MFESEIYDCVWIISPNLKISGVRIPFINKYEAENMINIMQCGLHDELQPIIMIDCSFRKYITKYKKSTLFTLTEITVSTITPDPVKGRSILSIKGTMPLNGISIRSKSQTKRILSNEEREKKAKNMRLIQLKSRQQKNL